MGRFFTTGSRGKPQLYLCPLLKKGGELRQCDKLQLIETSQARGSRYRPGRASRTQTAPSEGTGRGRQAERTGSYLRGSAGPERSHGAPVVLEHSSCSLLSAASYPGADPALVLS